MRAWALLTYPIVPLRAEVTEANTVSTFVSITDLLRSAQRREPFARACHLKPSLNLDFLP